MQLYRSLIMLFQLESQLDQNEVQNLKEVYKNNGDMKDNGSLIRHEELRRTTVYNKIFSSIDITED